MRALIWSIEWLVSLSRLRLFLRDGGRVKMSGLIEFVEDTANGLSGFICAFVGREAANKSWCCLSLALTDEFNDDFFLSEDKARTFPPDNGVVIGACLPAAADDEVSLSDFGFRLTDFV